jgi:hypothetical protein
MSQRGKSLPVGPPVQVETLFHEFGHAAQHMLTQQREGLIAGIRGVEWDAVSPRGCMHAGIPWDGYLDTLDTILPSSATSSARSQLLDLGTCHYNHSCASLPPAALFWGGGKGVRHRQEAVGGH